MSEKLLTLKTVRLMALSSLKRVGDLQALSISPSCMDFAPGLVKVYCDLGLTTFLRLLRTHFASASGLRGFPPRSGSSSMSLYPVRALRTDVDRTAQWRGSDQLFVCFGGKSRDSAVSKQRMSHWIVEAISLAYEACGFTSPLGLRAHSLRAMASSQTFLKGSSMEDVCAAAGWSSPSTFIKFYSLDVRMAPGSRVLSA